MLQNVFNSSVRFLCVQQPNICGVTLFAVVTLGLGVAGESSGVLAADPVLPGTRPLEIEEDLASEMVEGIDRFLTQETELAIQRRREKWRLVEPSQAAFRAMLADKRQKLANRLGLRDQRSEVTALQWIATTERPALLAETKSFAVYEVRWPVLQGITGVGLLLLPNRESLSGDMLVLPDADQTPEQLVGLAGGIAPELQFARRLAQRGYRVVVPTLISRTLERRAPPGQPGRANLTHREFVYRPAYELGRHVIGYELQKVFACIDWFEYERSQTETPEGADDGRPIGVVGYGEGGLLALYAAALDPRIDMTLVSGYFGPRDQIWQEPIDRNVFGQVSEFGGAELAAMVYPRTLMIDFRPGPDVELPSDGGAPGRLKPIPIDQQKAELARLFDVLHATLISESRSNPHTDRLNAAERGAGLFADATAKLEPIASNPINVSDALRDLSTLVATDGPPSDIDLLRELPDTEDRQQAQVRELDAFNQRLLRESQHVRREFMRNLDTSSLEAYQESIEPYRQVFRDEVIGRFDRSLESFNARSRRSWETDRWTGYEVVLDVFPEVIAYGVLLLPNDMQPDEQRPVVVCQHGLEGRPTDVFQGDHRAYHDFAARLCERGFIVFAPQNPYIFEDRFRTLQRKANPLGKTLFSVIVPQHQQIVNWLKQLPYVDGDRIGFYGLSYGGKSAMRIPALVTDYALSICSADFNEWVVKNATTRETFSYVWTGEYEIFEWDLGSTFNYAEMAALICPRPFMVERGHFDSVGTDEWVAFEYAKVRRLYQAKLGIGERTEIEWFAGPHTIHGQDTFDFVHRHLQWPKPDQ